MRRQDGEDLVEIRVNRGEDLLGRARFCGTRAKYDGETARWRLSRATAANLGQPERIIRGVDREQPIQRWIDETHGWNVRMHDRRLLSRRG
jgi:uncharacterized protein (DUF2235 family)